MEIFLAEITHPNGTKTYHLVYANNAEKAKKKVDNLYIGNHGVSIKRPIK